jgi:hypothetical protein
MNVESNQPAQRFPARNDRSAVRALRQFWASGPARIILGGAAGAGGGAAYAHYVGCLTGSCPITSNPLTAALFGAIFGAALFAPNRKAGHGSARPTKP